MDDNLNFTTMRFNSDRANIFLALLSVANAVMLVISFLYDSEWTIKISTFLILLMLALILYVLRIANIFWMERVSELSAKVNQLKGELSATYRNELNATYNRLDALFSIHHLLEINSPLPIMRGWAIFSDFGHCLVTTILGMKGDNVIDVGSGISTILSGYAIKKRGHGRVFSLEHDEVYFERTKRLIIEHELTEFVDLRFCPLSEYIIGGDTWPWYDLSKIQLFGSIGVMIVDGPPYITRKMARFPAIPLLHDYISLDTVILLDDGAREDEQQIAKAWCEEFNLDSQFVKSYKGIFIFKPRGPAQTAFVVR